MWNDPRMGHSKSNYLPKHPFCGVLMVLKYTNFETTRMNPAISDLDSWVRKGNPGFMIRDHPFITP